MSESFHPTAGVIGSSAAGGFGVRASVPIWALLVLAAVQGCSIINDVSPCEDVETKEELINSRQDADEFLDHARAAALISDTRALVAFSVQTDDGSKVTGSGVRMALLSRTGGSRVPICTRSAQDADLSEPDQLAVGASVAAAPLKLVDFDRKDLRDVDAAALVAWMDASATGASFARMRFVDASGCPLGPEGSFQPFVTPDTPAAQMPMRAVTIAWSEARGQVLALAHDDFDLWASWIDAPGTFPPVKLASGHVEVTGGVAIHDFPAVAIAPDGRALVAWFDAARGFRVLGLGPSGEITREPMDAGIPVTSFNAKNGISCAIAVGPGRFALVANASSEPDAPPRVFVREWSFDAEPLGSARPVDPDDHAVQSQPNAIYLPLETLLVTWSSASRVGTVGRFFQADGSPRFCSLGCGEGPFPIGTAGTGRIPATSALLSTGDSVWALHGGEDPRGEGIYLQQAPFNVLFPAQR